VHVLSPAFEPFPPVQSVQELPVEMYPALQERQTFAALQVLQFASKHVTEQLIEFEAEPVPPVQERQDAEFRSKYFPATQLEAIQVFDPVWDTLQAAQSAFPQAIEQEPTAPSWDPVLPLQDTQALLIFK
jgi:hypothetical protein